MYLLDLPDVLRRAPALRVIEEPGWRTRGHGPMRSVDGVVAHHTAGPVTGDAPSLRVVRDGRPGLSGPLAQLFLARSGAVHVVAAGLAYHAGQVTAVTYANGRRIGIEAEATGRDNVPTDWPPAQMTAYAQLCAALCLGYHFDPGDVLGHKEVAYPLGRKIDPNFGMSAFRTRVDAELDRLTGVSRDTPRVPAPRPPVDGRPVLQRGNTRASDNVRVLQRRLALLGWNPGGDDGVFGPRVEAAVRGLQVAAGLVDDGVVGPRTWKALDGGQKPRIRLARAVGRGDRGDVVEAVQRALLRVGARLPEFGADGRAGDEFVDAVRWLQAREGLTRDGVVAVATVPALGGVWTGPR